MSEVELRNQAWIGDAVLALYARRWLLEQPLIADSATRTELFRHLTSNQFLSGLGRPTEVEARIGRIYAEQSLEAAFHHIETQLVPLFLKQLSRAQRQKITVNSLTLTA